MPRLDDGEQFFLFWGHNLSKSTRDFRCLDKAVPLISTTSPFASSKMATRAAPNLMVFSVSGLVKAARPISVDLIVGTRPPP
jgi:hypothetical protein